MNKVKILILPLVIILALLWAGCEKKGEPVSANVPPDSRILSYTIGSVAEKDTSGNPTNSFPVTVYWSGSDKDGTLKGFFFNTANAIVDTMFTANTQRDFIFDFTDAAASYKVYIWAVDNDNVMDPTPAEATIVRAYGAVETQLVDGPPNGGVVSPAVHYKIQGTTSTGVITQIEYRVNDAASWSTITTDALGFADINVTGMAGGPNTLYFRAVRDDNAIDETPLSVSVVVRVGEFKPTINNTSPVVDGGGWFEGVELTFSWTVESRYYYGSMPAEPYSYEAVVTDTTTDPANWNTDPEAPLASGWSAEPSLVYSPASGSNTFYLKVRDLGGQVDTMRITFSAAAPSLDQGVLVVNGDDPNTYLSEMDPLYSVGAFWGTLPSVSFWDLFGDDTTPSMTLPASGVTYIGGGAQLAPDVMAKYSTIVWLGNNYSGIVSDLALWQLTPIYAYLQAGGNVVFFGRETATFMDDNLTNYLNVGWRDGANPGDGSSAGLITLDVYIPLFPGLVTMTPFSGGMSRANEFSVSGFGSLTSASSANWDADITSWDGVKGYTKSTLTHTLLFAHTSGGTSELAFARGLGVWSHPNFQFSNMDAGNELPGTTEEKRGNFISLTGRNYRADVDATTHNFDVILRNMCGEQ